MSAPRRRTRPRGPLETWEPDPARLVEIARPLVTPDGQIRGIHYALVDGDRAHPRRWGGSRRASALYAPGWWIFLGVPEPPRGAQDLIFRRERFIAAAAPAGETRWVSLGPLPPSYGGLSSMKQGEVDPFARGVVWTGPLGAPPAEPPPEDQMLLEQRILPRAEALLRAVLTAPPLAALLRGPRANPIRRRRGPR